MYTFLVSSGFALLLFSKSSKHVVLAGTVFVLAMMTRPDGVLFVFASCIYIVLTKEKILKNLIILLLPSVVIFLPYWLWRYSYYGLFFPNSFYAKSGDLAYYSQGMTYTILYFKTYYGFIVIPLVAFVSIIRNRKEFLSLSFFQTLRTEHHPIQRVALSLLFIGIYSFFIIRVGGDFMFARFFIPITPILFFLAETLLSQLNKPALTLAISILLLISIVFRYDQFTENDTIGYIADEAHYYSVQSIDRSKEHGLMLAKYFKDSPARIAFWAGQLRMMYYAEPGYALEASAGLTDTALSHLVLNERGRPGHEKTATTDFLLKRKINFFIAPFTVPPKGKPVLNAIIFNGIVARIIIYDTNIMTELEKYPEVRFVNFPRYLDEYITTMSRNPLQQLMADYQFFRSYYFDHNQDPVRQQAIEAYIRSLMQ